MTQTAARGGSMGSKGTSNAALLISWGQPLVGRESKAPQVLSDVLTYFGALAEREEIDGCQPIMLEPHGAAMQGCLLIWGSREGLAQLRGSPEFTQQVGKARLVVSHLDVMGGQTGPAFDEAVRSWHQQVQGLTGP